MTRATTVRALSILLAAASCCLPALADDATPTTADLVRQLGDPSWETREAATQALSGMGEKAKPDLETALKSEDPEVRYRAESILALLGVGSRQLPEAWTSRIQQLEAEPVDCWTDHADAGLRAKGLQDISTAEAELLDAMLLSRQLMNVKRQKTAYVCFELADLYATSGNPRAAVDCLREGLFRDPWDGLGSFRLGELLEKLGDKDEARERYHLSLRLDPDHPEVARAKAALDRLGAPKRKYVQPQPTGLVVGILPLEERIDLNMLKACLANVEANSGVTFKVLKPIDLLLPQFKVNDTQYDAEALLDVLEKRRNASEAAGGPRILVAVTSADIKQRGLNYIFGLSRAGVSIASHARFDNAFYGTPPCLALTTQRMQVQLCSCLGHALRLAPCPDATCAMATCGNLKEFDRKYGVFCPACQNLLAAYAAQQTGRFEEAERRLLNHLKQRPQDTRARYGLGLLYEGHDRAKATEAFREVLKLEPQSRGAREGLERCEAEMEKKR